MPNRNGKRNQDMLLRRVDRHESIDEVLRAQADKPNRARPSKIRYVRARESKSRSIVWVAQHEETFLIPPPHFLWSSYE